MTIDNLKCTIDDMPMENTVGGKIPTIQNTDEWIRKNRRDTEYYDFLHSIVDEIRKK